MREAEAAMQKGIDVARQQNARSWELRGAMSLARLRRHQDRHEEASALLAPILGWFQGGFDTADLKAAKTLLNKLTEQPIAGAILDLLSEDRTDEGFPSQNVTLGNLFLPEALGIGDRPAPPGP